MVPFLGIHAEYALDVIIYKVSDVLIEQSLQDISIVPLLFGRTGLFNRVFLLVDPCVRSISRWNISY